MARTVIVMPAYNAEKTLQKTLADIPEGLAEHVILVDDASTDRTAELARDLGLTVFVHERNRGYGANQKTCYREALKLGAEVVVMIHPDYQYDSALAPHLVDLIARGYFDVMLGTRIRTRGETMAGGMPWWKYLSNRFLTLAENVLTGQNLSEWHTGYRAYSRKVLETVPWERNSDDFIFDSQFLMQTAFLGFKIAEIPVPVRYYDDSSSINFKRSATYGLLTLYTALQFALARTKIHRAKLFEPK
ncbi:MAG: glycosyltransferase family 2 protein [Candidatus Alcyoniella australis]|nr:glycosyltransferase family 2 protein [Candidatus Alcyoniella australis]